MSVKYDWQTKDYTIELSDGTVEIFNSTDMTDLEEVSALVAILLKADAIGDEKTVDRLELYIGEICEDAELPFAYTRGSGQVRKYTPASDWEPSYSCEWEQSAEYGLDYGWNI